MVSIEEYVDTSLKIKDKRMKSIAQLCLKQYQSYICYPTENDLSVAALLSAQTNFNKIPVQSLNSFADKTKKNKIIISSSHALELLLVVHYYAIIHGGRDLRYLRELITRNIRVLGQVNHHITLPQENEVNKKDAKFEFKITTSWKNILRLIYLKFQKFATNENIIQVTLGITMHFNRYQNELKVLNTIRFGHSKKRRLPELNVNTNCRNKKRKWSTKPDKRTRIESQSNGDINKGDWIEFAMECALKSCTQYGKIISSIKGHHAVDLYSVETVAGDVIDVASNEAKKVNDAERLNELKNLQSALITQDN